MSTDPAPKTTLSAEHARVAQSYSAVARAVTYWKDACEKSRVENAALAERLRVAEAGPCARCKGCVCGHLTSDAAPAKSTDQ